MLVQLKNQCLALKNRNKKEKLKQCELPWEAGDDITTYFTKLNNLEEELENKYRIKWPTTMKIMVAAGAMYDSYIFSEK